ncbi:MAG: hypothetical protein JNL85_09870 [Rubrivivax sp.]|nr:hypothetical protein [Rubrivivax sp.]
MGAVNGSGGRLTQTALAAALGVSKSRVTALKRMGMPTHNLALATAWRARTLDPARTKEGRADGNTGLAFGVRPRAEAIAALVELAEGIAEVMMDDAGRPHIFAEGLPHLRAVLRKLPADALARVRLPLRCWDALTGFDRQ